MRTAVILTKVRNLIILSAPGLLFWVSGISGVCAQAQEVNIAQVDYPSVFDTGSTQNTVLTGIHLTETESFHSAESLFVALAATHPKSPIGPLFVAATIIAQMLDTESPARATEFHRWLDEATAEAERWREFDPESGEPEFILGVAEGYEAVYESHWGGWFAALKRGIGAKKHFTRCIKLDSTIIDAHLGLGTYNYWKSAKTDFINWLPVVGDNRRRGLAQLRRVIADGVLSANAARASMCYALINEEDYASAIAHADTLATIIAPAKAPLWIKAEASMKLYRWQDAIALYREIEQRIIAVGPGNNINLIECSYQIAHALYEAGLYKECLAACGTGLGYATTAKTRKQCESRLKKLRKLQRDVKKLIGS